MFFFKITIFQKLFYCLNNFINLNFKLLVFYFNIKKKILTILICKLKKRYFTINRLFLHCFTIIAIAYLFGIQYNSSRQ